MTLRTYIHILLLFLLQCNEAHVDIISSIYHNFSILNLTRSPPRSLKITITTSNGEACFAVEDAAECSAWVRAFEKKVNRTAWVHCLRGSGWKSCIASVHGNNFGLFTSSHKATLSLSQCTLVRTS